MRKEMEIQFAQNRFNINEMKGKLEIFDNRLKIHIEELKSQNLIQEVYKRNIQELYDLTQDLQIKKLDEHQLEKTFHQIDKKVRYMENEVNNAKMSLDATDAYLDKYLPVKI